MGKNHFSPRTALPTPWGAELPNGEGLVSVEETNQRAQFVERSDHGELPPEFSDRISLEIPGHVLPQINHPTIALEGGQQFRMANDHGADLSERGPSALRFSGEGSCQVAEKPRPTETTTSDDHPVTTCLGHHLQRVLGLPEVAVAQHRNAHCLFELCNAGPVSPAGVGLLHGSSMQRDCGCPFLLSNDPRIKEGLVGLINTDPSFDRDGNPEFICCPHGSADDGAQPVAFVRQNPSSALACDLGNGTAEIEIDVMNAMGGDQELRRMRHGLWIHAVELHRADGLARVERQHRVGFVIPGDDSPRREHLTDIQSSPLFQTESPVSGIRYPGHRGQHHWELHHDGVTLAGRVQAKRLDHSIPLPGFRPGDSTRGWMGAMNPLLTASTLPFQIPDYANLTDAQFKEAMEVGLTQQRAALEMIATNPETPDVENTIAAWELSSTTLDRAGSAFWVVKAADANEQRDAVETALAPKLAEHSNAILLDRRLYDRLVALRSRADSAEVDLDEQDRYWLDEHIREFERSGILLDADAQQRLRKLNVELASLSVAFEQALVEGRNSAAVLVTDPTELTGLSEGEIAAARQAAWTRGQEGWLIELTNTTGQPVLESLTNRDLRRRVLEASLGRGLGGEHDTRQLVLDIARRRAERARLLGYEHHAAWVAASGCARTTEAVLNLLERVAAGAVKLANSETSELQKALEQDVPGARLAAWDWEHYAAKRSTAEAVDPAELRPYLEYHRVLHDGVFAAATALYGITFHARHDLCGFTPDSEVYEVREANGSPLGAVILDPFTRPTKRGGAWMTSIVDQSDLTGSLPVVTNTCNFSRPTEGASCLLTWDNVITMFHEFGHALHGLLSEVSYPSRAGTAVPRDFVEFPSQVNELWAWDETLVSRFAIHHETGDPLPSELIARLRSSRSAGEGHHTLELVAAMLLDQAWHTTALEELPTSVDEVESFETAVLERAGVAHALVPPRYRSCYFSHIFGGGYAAAYYGYLWAEVLDADACAWFAKNGGLCRKAGEAFRRELLGRGGSIEPMQAWRNFRRSDPDVSHLLSRKGLTVEQR